MNLRQMVSPMKRLAFQAHRAIAVILPGGRIRAFGPDRGQIGTILVINLERQPERWRRVARELARFRTSTGAPLTSVTRRLVAVDARDGRAVAATADVDPVYRIGDQLHVQPDERLAACFAEDEPVRMTRQEVAVARSHVEAWKAIATGAEDYVLVLEDDAWFTPGAAAAIDRGWDAAHSRYGPDEGPRLLYLSYADAGGTAVRDDPCDALFCPVRGLWFLSGYVLSRVGAATLLRAMPVVGPVDLWMNYRFDELGALALSSPVIAQRQDAPSDNAYSVLPYLARAGIIDADHLAEAPDRSHLGPVLAWTARPERESLAMALSMLGLRVRVFDGGEQPMEERELNEVLQTFDALVDAPLAVAATAAVRTNPRAVILHEAGASTPAGLAIDRLPLSRSALLPTAESGARSWSVICNILGLDKPVDSYPAGAPRAFRLFRDDRPTERRGPAAWTRRNNRALDDSPWVLPSNVWLPARAASRVARTASASVVEASMTEPSPKFPALTETFPGNQATFDPEGVEHTTQGTHLKIRSSEGGQRPYRSGAFASNGAFSQGRFEAEIRAAAGSGLITGFFLHRDAPRQEIDIEFAGADPRRMLANIFFNPGDDGATLRFGYRGSPAWIDLGFDATTDFHLYGIDWQPHRVAWLVDGTIVHERVGWDPTPIPHLPMRLHANLWIPRSHELAGQIDPSTLPAAATFRNVRVRA